VPLTKIPSFHSREFPGLSFCVLRQLTRFEDFVASSLLPRTRILPRKGGQSDSRCPVSTSKDETMPFFVRLFLLVREWTHHSLLLRADRNRPERGFKTLHLLRLLGCAPPPVCICGVFAYNGQAWGPAIGWPSSPHRHWLTVDRTSRHSGQVGDSSTVAFSKC